jgi:hypothetical protein
MSVINGHESFEKKNFEGFIRTFFERLIDPIAIEERNFAQNASFLQGRFSANIRGTAEGF